MKKSLHPTLHDINARCVCGNSFPTVSTTKDVEVGICHKCHPFYTRQHKYVDTAGRIEKFNAKFKNLDFSKSKN